jgi:hypothetical protein
MRVVGDIKTCKQGLVDAGTTRCKGCNVWLNDPPRALFFFEQLVNGADFPRGVTRIPPPMRPGGRQRGALERVLKRAFPCVVEMPGTKGTS